jgi:thiol-disulfide isomerase/thioredoxin
VKREALLTWVAIAVLAAISAGLGLWLGKRVYLGPEQPPPPGLEVAGTGDYLPLIALPELESGALLRISGPGRTRVINYWASWCGPCREEMPALDAYAAEQGDNGVQVIGIALDNREDALAFAREVAVGFTLLIEAPGPADSSVQLGNTRGVLPFTALVDAEGRLLKTHYGAFSGPAAVRDFAGQ